jgi:hypothetical protein
MQIVIELPDDNLRSPATTTRQYLPPHSGLIAADHHRQDHISAAEVHRMLNLSSRWETSIALHRTS